MVNVDANTTKALSSSVYSKKLEAFIEEHFKGLAEVQAILLSAVRYSLLQKAAKRFRARLACITIDALGALPEQILPFAAALECVHTYSLIHDDLPCMDNDDFRRGEPTSHKVFGEATALLAGDALQAEAFSLIAQHYSSRPEIGLKLVALLSCAAGMRGMISGQMYDLESGKVKIDKIEDLQRMHEQKTGALILVSIEGAALVGNASTKQTLELCKFGRNLGLAFQVKDDLLDFPDDKGASYTSFMGFDGAQNYLRQLTEHCLADLSEWNHKAEDLREMARYNCSRKN